MALDLMMGYKNEGDREHEKYCHYCTRKEGFKKY